MKAPEFRLFQKEDFPDAPWIEKLLRPLNTVLSQVRSGLDRSLTLGENLNAEVKTIDVVARDEWIAPTFTNSWAAFSGSYPVAYRWEQGGIRLRGLVAGGAVNTSALTLPGKPAQDVVLDARCSGGTARVDLKTDGTVVIGAFSEYSGTPGTFTSLDGLFSPVAEAPPANPAFPVKFKTSVRGKAAAVVLGKCVELNGRNEIPVHSAYVVGWGQDGENVILRNVTGLVGGKTYRLTVLVLGG